MTLFSQNVTVQPPVLQVWCQQRKAVHHPPSQQLRYLTSGAQHYLYVMAVALFVTIAGGRRNMLRGKACI
jgi:hypothetical protein